MTKTICDGYAKIDEPLTIDDFYIKSYVPWDVLKKTFGKEEYKKFIVWLFGQTTYPEGVYVHDLALYLRHYKEN